MKSSALWWWIDRWRKSTAYSDMTLEEQAAYRNLLDEATLRGGELPDDDRILAKASGDALSWRRLKDVVMARFQLVAGVYRNETLDHVLRESARRRKKQQDYRDRERDEADDGNGTGNATGNDGGNGGGNEAGNSGGNGTGVPVLSTRALVQQERTAPERESRPRRSEWARAIAIAHICYEQHPDDFTSCTELFKQKAGEQGIDYGFRKDGRPLYARALDFVAQVRADRARAATRAKGRPS